MKNLSSLAALLNNPSWDLALPVVIFAVIFFYGIARGKRRIAVTIIYTYVALAVFAVLPLERISKVFGSLDIFWAKSAIFLILFILLTLLLSAKKSRGFASLGSWWQIFLLGLAQAGLLAHILFGFLPADRTEQLTPLIKNIFINPSYGAWWMIVPIVIVVLLRRLEKK